MATLVNGVDISTLTFDKLYGEALASKDLYYGPDHVDISNKSYKSKILGGVGVQLYGSMPDETTESASFKSLFGTAKTSPQYPVFNLQDSNAPANHLTTIYRNSDGTLGVRYYEKKDTFLQDMAMFAAAATGIYGGINALAETVAESAVESAASDVVSGVSDIAGTSETLAAPEVIADTGELAGVGNSTATISGMSDLAGTSETLAIPTTVAPPIETASSLSLADIASGVKSGASVLSTGASLYSLGQRIGSSNSPRPVIPVRVSPRPSGSGFTNQYYSPSELANMAADQETASQRIAPQSPVRQTSAAMPTQIAGIPINKIVIGVAVVAVAYVIFKHGKVAAPAA